jgi:hypothetical protein
LACEVIAATTRVRRGGGGSGWARAQGCTAGGRWAPRCADGAAPGTAWHAVRMGRQPLHTPCADPCHAQPTWACSMSMLTSATTLSASVRTATTGARAVRKPASRGIYCTAVVCQHARTSHSTNSPCTPHGVAHLFLSVSRCRPYPRAAGRRPRASWCAQLQRCG